MARPGCSCLQRSRQKSALRLSSKEERQTAELAAALLKEAADYHLCGITASMPPCCGGGCLFAPLRGKAATFGKKRRVQSKKAACSVRDSRDSSLGEVVGEAASCDACYCRSEADFPRCANLIATLLSRAPKYTTQCTGIGSPGLRANQFILSLFFQSMNKDCPSPIC